MCLRTTAVKSWCVLFLSAHVKFCHSARCEVTTSLTEGQAGSDSSVPAIYFQAHAVIPETCSELWRFYIQTSVFCLSSERETSVSFFFPLMAYFTHTHRLSVWYLLDTFLEVVAATGWRAPAFKDFGDGSVKTPTVDPLRTQRLKTPVTIKGSFIIVLLWLHAYLLSSRSFESA